MKVANQIIIKILFGLILICNFSIAKATNIIDDDLALKVLHTLSTKSLVRADFIQDKKIASLSKPLRSSGTMLFIKQQGILWRLNKPVLADIIVTPKKMVQQTVRTTSAVNLEQTPYGNIAKLLFKLMSGDYIAIQEAFTIQDFKVDKENWSIKFLPKDENIKQLFISITASGNQYVNKVILVDFNNDEMIINFSNYSEQPANLEPHEKQLFKSAE